MRTFLAGRRQSLSLFHSQCRALPDPARPGTAQLLFISNQPGFTKPMQICLMSQNIAVPLTSDQNLVSLHFSESYFLLQLHLCHFTAKVTCSCPDTGFLWICGPSNYCTDRDQRSVRGTSLSGLPYRRGVSVGGLWCCLYRTVNFTASSRCSINQKKTAELFTTPSFALDIYTLRGEIKLQQGREGRRFLALFTLFFLSLLNCFSSRFLFLKKSGPRSSEHMVINTLYYICTPPSQFDV